MSEDTSARCRASVLNAIPEKWRVPGPVAEDMSRSAMDKLKSCGILTARQEYLTELSATELLSLLVQGELTSMELTEAFCARAAIAHQLVRANPPTVFEPVPLTNVLLDELPYGFLPY
jgi:amidase